MSIHVKIKTSITKHPAFPFVNNTQTISILDTLIHDTLLDRDFVLALSAGDILFHDGFELEIIRRVFISNGAGGAVSAVLIVNNVTK